jgi:uncharacterized repeat protein (TIGR03803 family)
MKQIIMREKTMFLFLTLGLILTLISSTALNAATQKVLYAFTNNRDGGDPHAGVIFGPDGNLYGVTEYGGDYGKGTVFQLSHDQGGTWRETVLYSFTGEDYGTDGYNPLGGLTFDDAGNLYGTTYSGGPYSCGIIFKLTPSGSSWNYTVERHFYGISNKDGCHPHANLRYDNESGMVFGTTAYGGRNPDYPGQGVAFAGNYNVYYLPRTGHEPAGGINAWGYGTTWAGGKYWSGNVFKLSEVQREVKIKHVFNPAFNAGYNPNGDLLTQNINGTRVMYGTNFAGGTGGHGTAYQLIESPNKSDVWNIHVLHSFSGVDGGGPLGGMILDGAGNLYGITEQGGPDPGDAGTVFKLTRGKNNKWTHTLLYSFTGGVDGGWPESGLIIDAAGNLYGTTPVGGPGGAGVVYEIIP